MFRMVKKSREFKVANNPKKVVGTKNRDLDEKTRDI